MKIYLSIPYTGCERRSFKAANKVAAKLMKDGHIVFSPISHTHPIAKIGKLPTTWDYWEKYDTSFIEWCDVVYVVVMKNNGHTRIMKSKGVMAEIKIGMNLNKEIIYIKEM
jgi:hypothetical protein